VCNTSTASWLMLIVCYSSKSDATYVVNFNEYEGLAAKILKRRPTRPIVVFVETPDIEKAFSKASKSNLDVHYSLLAFTQQKRNGNRLFLPSDDEEGDGQGGQGDDTDADEVSINQSFPPRRH
jgi:hypothetical protein